MKSLFLVFLFCLSLFAGTAGKPTPIVIGDVYDFEPTEVKTKKDDGNSFESSEIKTEKKDTDSSQRYYTFTMREEGNIFIVNPDPKNPHRYRIYDENFKLIESDIVKESKAESLYRGKYLYHNLSGAFSIFSNKLK
jgi:hypothetical protein